ncbi:S1 family peptidase [Oricola thermophila]|uniref:Trypsin-like peptidase domain-containing protein n=1 Tax=Oricola thermophila TaxID=2742145 RepID=A0A6N1VFF0_9HYPH|nr:serine protease [Oricola thermophila]QKV17869.1 trypsin-like peptidase domain-containing protein [Oricola thermophila]
MLKYGIAGLKFTVLCFAAILVGVTLNTFQSPQTIPVDSAVKVINGTGHGTGFYVGHDMVITAQHVVDDAATVTIKTADGETVTGEVLWTNVKYDIAAIRVSLPISPAYLSCTTPAYGDEIVIHGNPVSEEFVSVWGRVSGSEHSAGRWASIVPINAAVVPGQSGGPVYGMDGAVVGMIVGAPIARLGMAASLTGLGAIVPGVEICRMMGRA